MDRTEMHPNTQTLLSAWERISNGKDGDGPAPRTRDYPDLIAGIFVIDHLRENNWVFRNAGPQLERVMGRALIDHDFISLWSETDRHMVASFLTTVHQSARPGFLMADGVALTGESIDFEITLAPLVAPDAARRPARLLGLYQHLSPVEMLRKRPVWKHALKAIYPPRETDTNPRLRLVSVNA